MAFFLIGIAVLLGSGFLAFLIQPICRPGHSNHLRQSALAHAIGGWGALIGCLMAVTSSLFSLATGARATIRAFWTIPYGTFYLELDPLSAFFSALILGFSAFAAIYGLSYLQAYRSKKAMGPAWLFFNLLIAGMAITVTARNGLLFLMAWEIMALASFFLVMFEDENEQTRHAGVLYLVASHIGTAFIFLFWMVLGRTSGSLDFDQFVVTNGAQASMLFVFAVIGFGTKAGFMPVHIWLPEAHPAAPSHVSALMSAVMIKTGIYGVIRALMLLGAPQGWWGTLLIVIGIASGAGGILYALAQNDLKRLLAYSSVENIGIIVLGLGLGVTGSAYQLPALAALGYTAALLHVLNHAMFKGLLFFGAGAVVHVSGTREMNQMGGLLKKMPFVGACFLVGAVAIAGFPPLNGFLSEFLTFFAAYSGVVRHWTSPAAGAAVMVILVLALIGGLAAAGFSKLFGTIFLGEPRGVAAEHAGHGDPRLGLGIKVAMGGLAIGCLFVGVTGAFWIDRLLSVVNPLLVVQKAPWGSDSFDSEVLASLKLISLVAILFLILVGGLAWFRIRLLRARQVRTAVTWDCGFAAPSARIQYTGSSFVQPITAMFQRFLRVKEKGQLPVGYFPKDGAFESATPDFFRYSLFEPVFSWIEKRLVWFRRFQHGRIQLYILYIVATLIALLVWQVRF